MDSNIASLEGEAKLPGRSEWMVAFLDHDDEFDDMEEDIWNYDLPTKHDETIGNTDRSHSQGNVHPNLTGDTDGDNKLSALIMELTSHRQKCRNHKGNLDAESLLSEAIESQSIEDEATKGWLRNRIKASKQKRSI